MTLWVHKGGSNGEREQRMLENNVLAMGWSEMDCDLAKLKTREDFERQYRTAYADAGEHRARMKNHVGQLWAFVHEAKAGDLVVVPLKTRSTIAIGKITGAYRHGVELGQDMTHLRPVKWVKTDLSRGVFGQDLLYSFGAFMTFCQASRNNAEDRVRAVLDKGIDPEKLDGKKARASQGEALEAEAQEIGRDLEQDGLDGIRKFIEVNFKGHRMADLVNAVLRARGFVTRVSPPGPDGGVDILAGAGPMGLDSPRLCVQVKSGSAPCDNEVFQRLKGTMDDCKAEQGLLVSWGGFKESVLKEVTRSFFKARVWDSADLIKTVLENYDKLGDEIQAQLPLKRIWTLAVTGEE